MSRSPLRAAPAPVALLAAALMLSGCISLFPKAKPALLYRFGPAEPPAAEAPPSATAARPVLGLGPIAFDSAAANDRILTVTGQGTAYIEAARWISPAPTLFEQALIRTFETTPGAPRIAQRGGALRAPATLSLNVEAFEARYDQGQDAAPLVVVRVHAYLTRNDTRMVVGDRFFTAEVRASDNRQGPIVAAFQAAVQQVLGQLVAWAPKG